MLSNLAYHLAVVVYLALIVIGARILIRTMLELDRWLERRLSTGSRR